MIDDLPSDEPLEVLVWTLARDARDLRDRAKYGMRLEGKLLKDIRQAHLHLWQAMNMDKIVARRDALKRLAQLGQEMDAAE